MPTQSSLDPKPLQCMEIWGGSEPLERNVSTPGLDIWVLSEPFHGEEQGGDVYYVTLCGGGVTTRIVLADVSGHGTAVAEFSDSLRNILRKNINRKNQRSVVQSINQQFSDMAQYRRFATAIVATYLTSTDTLSLCNAGHPRPLIYRAGPGQWSFLPDDSGASPGNLPLGLDEDTTYTNYQVKLAPDDLILLYTDAMIEAADPSGHLLGEQGLLTLATNLQPALKKPSSTGRALIQSVARYRQNQAPDDDLTVIAIHHTAAPTPPMSVAQKLDVYAKVFGLKHV